MLNYDITLINDYDYDMIRKLFPIIWITGADILLN